MAAKLLSVAWEPLEAQEVKVSTQEPAIAPEGAEEAWRARFQEAEQAGCTREEAVQYANLTVGWLIGVDNG